MSIDALPYPERLVAEMITFSLFQSTTTKDMEIAQVFSALKIFFTDEQLNKAKESLLGEARKIN